MGKIEPTPEIPNKNIKNDTYTFLGIQYKIQPKMGPKDLQIAQNEVKSLVGKYSYQDFLGKNSQKPDIFS